MNDSQALTARIEALEIRLAYQDQVVEDLNKTIAAQWTQIDTLKRQMERLTDRLQDVEDNRGASSPTEPPPHY